LTVLALVEIVVDLLVVAEVVVVVAAVVRLVVVFIVGVFIVGVFTVGVFTVGVFTVGVFTVVVQSGKASTASIVNSRVAGTSTSSTGMWKSSARTTRSCPVIPNSRSSASQAAVLPVPLVPMKAVSSLPRSIVVRPGPKHLKFSSTSVSMNILHFP
jgi:hypothetical protein